MGFVQENARSVMALADKNRRCAIHFMQTAHRRFLRLVHFIRGSWCSSQTPKMWVMMVAPLPPIFCAIASRASGT